MYNTFLFFCCCTRNFVVRLDQSRTCKYAPSLCSEVCLKITSFADKKSWKLHLFLLSLIFGLLHSKLYVVRLLIKISHVPVSTLPHFARSLPKNYIVRRQKKLEVAALVPFKPDFWLLYSELYR